MVKAVSAGIARLSHEVFQNLQKMNSHSQDQAKVLQEMIQKTVLGLNERCYAISQAHFHQIDKSQAEHQNLVAQSVSQALATDENLPLAHQLEKKLQSMKKDLKDFEVLFSL